MNEIGIKRDKITPSFIEAYRKWWTDVQKRYEQEVSKETLERESETIIEITPKDLEEKLQMTQLNVVIKHLHTEFSKEFPWYRIDLKTFREAYIHHPLGWKFIFDDGKSKNKHSELFRDYYEKAFERISSYDNTSRMM